MAIEVKTMDHVTIVSQDLERTKQFYVDLLGMRLVERPGFAFPGLWFQAGQTQIHVNVEGEEAGPTAKSWDRGSVVSRGHHIAFLVDDAQAACDELKSQGVEIAAGPKRRPDGPLQFYIFDPDGNLVELFSLV